MNVGWQTKRLADFSVAVSTGPFGSVLHKADYVDHGVPLVNPINIVDERIEPDPSKLISDVTKARLGSYVLQEGDVVVGRRGEIGRCAVVGPMEAGWVCGTGSFFIRPLPSVNSQFLAQLIRSCRYRERLEKASTGATMKNLSNTVLADLLISIPSLAEQHRIVAILDEAFDGIATARTNAEQNLQNARALFESHLQSVFSQGGEGWLERRLGDIFHIGSSKRIYENEWTSSGVPFYGGREIVKLAAGVTPVVSAAHITEKKYCELASQYDMPQAGNILMTARGTIGVGYVVKNGDRFYFKDGNIISFREKTPTNPWFILFAFRTKLILDQIGDLTGATVKHLPIEKANALTIKIPGLAAQNSLVEKMRTVEAETQRLESIYQSKLAALDALKKSLLHQAFSGAL